MSFQGVLITLNDLKKKGVIQDYAIAGGYALFYYLEPQYTEDLDIIILLESGDEFHKFHQYFKEKGNKIAGIYIYIDDMQVQFFPAYGGDLFEGAVRSANKIIVKSIPSKVVNVEHLIALLLKAYRAKDKIRIAELLPKANGETLSEILRKYDNANDNFQIKFGRLLRTIQAG